MKWTPPSHGVTMRQEDTHVVCGQGIRGASMDKFSIIGIDISKRSFQVHGATADGAPVLRRKLTRAKVLEYLASQPRCLVVMETCGGASLGAGDPTARPRGPAGRADVRQGVREAPEERCARRGGGPGTGNGLDVGWGHSAKAFACQGKEHALQCSAIPSSFL